MQLLEQRNKVEIMTRKLKNVSWTLMVLSLFVVASTLQAVEIQHLRCEYLVNPLGIDAVPRLSWEIGASNERGVKQVAYQILMASSEAHLKKGKGDLWDSGKVASDQQNQIAYEGKPLGSKMRCYWKVRIWISSTLNPEPRTPTPSAWSTPAYWTMGLLTPAEKWSDGTRPNLMTRNGIRLLFVFRKKNLNNWIFRLEN
jgi:alpha-L-rhamnosidase